jgi:hypothetical protein
VCQMALASRTVVMTTQNTYKADNVALQFTSSINSLVRYQFPLATGLNESALGNN